MTLKRNPLNLNALQLRTLTILQELARLPDIAVPDPASGATTINALPHAHGDHFHIGDKLVMSRDASGLNNPAVWAALERKGVVKTNFPENVVLTADGAAYDTGLREAIFHGHDH